MPNSPPASVSPVSVSGVLEHASSLFSRPTAPNDSNVQSEDTERKMTPAQSSSSPLRAVTRYITKDELSTNNPDQYTADPAASNITALAKRLDGRKTVRRPTDGSNVDGLCIAPPEYISLSGSALTELLASDSPPPQDSSEAEKRETLRDWLSTTFPGAGINSVTCSFTVQGEAEDESNGKKVSASAITFEVIHPEKLARALWEQSSAEVGTKCTGPTTYDDGVVEWGEWAEWDLGSHEVRYLDEKMEEVDSGTMRFKASMNGCVNVRPSAAPSGVD